MSTSYSTLLGLALPVQGELQGVWGNTVNDYITNYLDSAVAGTQTLSTDADVTLTKTTGTALGATSSQYAILNCTGARTALRTITAPAASKVYVIINATTGGYSVKLVGAGPTTGVTIANGEKATVAWNGSDFVKVGNTSGAGVFTSVTDSALTSGRVTYATTGGLLTDSANLTFDGTYLVANSIKDSALTSGRVTYAGASGLLQDSSSLTFDGTTLTAGGLATGGSVTLSGGTANGVLYLNGSKVATSGSALTFDGTNLSTTGAVYGGTGNANANVIAKSNVANGGAGYSQFLFGNTNSDSRGYLSYTHAADAILFGTAGGLRATLDSSGNFGLGVTPPTLGYGRQITISQGAGTASPSLVHQAVNTNDERIYLTNNMAFATSGFSGTYTYIKTGAAASYYIQLAGQHQWHTAPSGTAGAAISFTQAMTLDASGNLSVGTTTMNPAGFSLGMNLNGASTTGYQVSVGGTFTGFFAGYSGETRIGSLSTYPMTFYTNGSERARITSGGELLVGTTTTTNNIRLNQKLAVVAVGSNVLPGIAISGYSGTTVTARPILDFNRSRSTVDGGVTAVANGDYLGTIVFRGADGSTFADGALINAIVDGAVSSGTVPTSITLNTNSGGVMYERARIDSSGNLLVGKLAQSATTVGVEARPDGGFTCTSSASANTTSTVEVYSTGASAYRFYVGLGGTVFATNTTISAISDQRLKENVRDLDVGLDAVMALKPRKFDWKEGKGKNIKDDRGFIAQEIEQVFPDLVDEWADPAPEGEKPYKSVRQDLIPVLVKAIQELKAEVDSLKAQLESK